MLLGAAGGADDRGGSADQKLHQAAGGVGAILALGLTRLMGSLLFGVQATDPVTFGSVIVVVAIAAAAAGWLPAYRAARVDTMSVLRNE